MALRAAAAAASALLAFAALAPAASAAVPPSSAPFAPPFPVSDFSATESLSPTMQLFWKVDAAAGTITVGVASLQAPGWAGVGFSDNGGMTGADIVTGRLAAASGAAISAGSTPGFVVEDRYATTFAEPKVDSSPSATALFGFQNATMTAFVFRRPLTARCNGESTSVSATRAQWVIFAHGESNELAYHGDNRGQKHIFLQQPVLTFPDLPADVLNVTIATPPVVVPRNKTTMYCYSLHQLPSDRPYHVIREEPVITSKRAHHMILYSCTAAQVETARSRLNGSDVACNSYGAQRERKFANPCTAFFTGWALGGKEVVLPEGVGRPMGGDKGPSFVLLEMHLDNVAGEPDTTDSSGMRLSYTPNLRAQDMGVLTLGVFTQQIVIPPQTSNYTIRSICPSDCTSQLSQKSTIFGAVLHMHTAGRSMRTRIIRNGTELEPLAQAHYDNAYQGYILSDGREELRPGDTVVTECTWNTVGRSENVTGGEETSQEMCFSFLNVFPAPSIDVCMTTATDPKVAFCPPADAQVDQVNFRNFLRLQTMPQGVQEWPVTGNQCGPVIVSRPSAAARWGAGLVGAVGAAVLALAVL
ncbi:PHM/PNGase F domain-containing protein [Hyaloraphidium curvatum]|nr:PHM/PNGase F domain-containing protein [Hyaloraphidium curvatum]